MTPDSNASDPAEAAAEFDQPMLRHDPGRKPWVRCLMQVLWPSFVGAAITVGILFSLIDPLQIEWVHVNLADSRQASYTIGFLVLWALFTISCGMTWFLANSETPADKPGKA